jgi:ELWxxDGT repeat protein
MSRLQHRIGRAQRVVDCSAQQLEPRFLLAAVPFDAFAAPADALLGPAVELGGTAYFFARDSSAPADTARAELWKSDGTPAGTVATGVSFPAPTQADAPASLTVLDGRLLFAATDGQLGRELWLSDGTPAGTARASDFSAPGARPDALTVVGGQAFFTLDDAATGRELWRTDGTPAGTRLVADIHPTGSSNPALLTPFAGRLFFVADDGTHGREIWSSDGTPGGTSMLTDLRPGSASPQVTMLYPGPTPAGDRLFFNADAGGSPATGVELWATDGTAAGTRLVKDIFPGTGGSLPGSFATFKESVYFAASDGRSGRELWRTDGTDAGTLLVSDLQPGNTAGEPTDLTPLGDRLLFVAWRPAGDGHTFFRGLWSTDGTANGTIPIQPATPDNVYVWRDLRVVGDRVVFVGSTPQTGQEPWATDGTDAGTTLLRDIATGPSGSRPMPLANAGNRLVFAATDIIHGAAPWVTDGTPDGTILLGRVAGDTRGVQMSRVVPAGNFLYAFGGYDSPYLGTTLSGLWRSDGSVAGTTLVAADPSFPREPAFALAAGNKLFFGGYGIWATDGTTAGTYKMHDGRLPDRFSVGQAQQVAVVGDALYFSIQPDYAADELWKSDGTPEGTVLVKSFGGLAERYRAAAFLRPLGDQLFFYTTDGIHGYEPWVSDGTEQGTQLLYDVNPGPEGSNLFATPAAILAAPVGDKVYFRASDGTHFNALWLTDGTPAGTRFVKDLVPGSGMSLETRPWPIWAPDGDILYFQAFDPTGELGVWRSDGTDAGTQEIVGGMSNWLTGLATWNHGLYIPFNTGTSTPPLTAWSMYRSDGTTAGTTLVRTFGADTSYSSPADPVAGPDAVYFMARGTTGRDLWKTDGTPGGTVLVHDSTDEPRFFNPQPAPFAGGMWFIDAGRVWTTRQPPSVVDRHVFYNRSSFDGNDAGANAADDAAIAMDKNALLAGQDRLPGFDNVTSFDRGINGVMIDVKDLPVIDALLDVNDFEFSPAGHEPISVDVRPGAGVDGSDRITLIWRDYNPLDTSPLPQAVGNGWLTVTMKANGHTGLSAPDVFRFGNLIGETGDAGATLGWRVNALDLTAVRRALNAAAPITSATDFNRDGRTNALDLSIVKRNLNRSLGLFPASAALTHDVRTRRVADDLLA